MDDLFSALSKMKPEKALEEVTKILSGLLADLDEAARQRLLVNLLAQSGDKVSSLVHL